MEVSQYIAAIEGNAKAKSRHVDKREDQDLEEVDATRMCLCLSTFVTVFMSICPAYVRALRGSTFINSNAARTSSTLPHSGQNEVGRR